MAFVAMVLLGCSSSDDGSGTDDDSDGTEAALPTDAHTFCVTPSNSAQDAPLPPTGGVSGTLSFGPYPEGTTGCVGVRFATGDSIAARAAPQNPLFQLLAGSPKPLLTVSVGEAFDTNPVFGQLSIVTGMSFKGGGLNFPDGDYYMSISKATGEGPRVQTISLTATNGVLTVAPLRTDGIFGTPGTNSQFPQLVLANSTAILALYPRGVLPPDPGEAETNTPRTMDVGDDGLPPLPTDPPPTGQTIPDAHGLPPPLSGTLIGYSHYLWQPGCAGEACDAVRPIYSNEGGTTPIDAAAGMFGTVTFSMAIAYMTIQAIDIDCPSDWDVTVAFNGEGIIRIPESHPFVSASCVIDFSTVRAGGGTGYGFTVALRGLAIGDH